MPVNITESDVYPTTLSSPVSGEPASAPDLASAFLQGAANRMNWINRRLRGLGSAPDTITGVPSNGFSTLVQVPAASELPGPNAFTRVAQGLADQAAYLRARILGAGTGPLQVEVLSAPLAISGWVPALTGTPSTGSGVFSFGQSSTSGYIYFPARTPIAGRITQIQFYGRGSGHSAAPASPVRVELITLGDTADPTILYTLGATAAYPDYDTLISYGSSAINVTISPSTFYAIRVIAESGANSVAAGFQIFSIRLGFQA